VPLVRDIDDAIDEAEALDYLRGQHAGTLNVR